ncbi:hypothetical protein [Mesorhizobium sp.]|nr:hypothetical protein [Mesorhizobium sp.]RWH50054.1 MAG: hypothetical protein EOQ82_31765 [Mesorhizobium sp.]RWI77768.1 MAG: hypothetical protein EOR19_14000 [Mesorhizobium sp.]RWJ27133.1 MAG: hypothetical protein EOR28_24745 [Mesorhizobium sp.]RWJ44915.1 MAG: hypothetical protein EOR31_18680 [Mesorhizobium sp.]
MGSGFEDEFRPVDDILRSGHRTRGVDAFTLTYLRAERQIRKIFTHLIFQSEAFDHKNSQQLRQALHDAPDLSFKKLTDGIQRLANVTVAELVGAEYDRLFKVLQKAKRYRDKLFHGQLPDQYVSTEEFIQIERDIRTWCELLAAGALKHIGYDGILDSHRKLKRPEIVKRVTELVPNLKAYEEFLKKLR